MFSVLCFPFFLIYLSAAVLFGLPGCTLWSFRSSSFSYFLHSFKQAFTPAALFISIMRYSTSILALAAPLVAFAAPTRLLGKRAAADILVFRKYHLEQVVLSLTKSLISLQNLRMSWNSSNHPFIPLASRNFRIPISPQLVSRRLLWSPSS